jgi:ribose/xylose/arabinose/galactoside ABC-type transport system permease subunit
MSQNKRMNIATKFTFFRELALIGMIILISLITFIIRPDFLTLSNITVIFAETVLLILLAVGEMMVIVTGNIDLSPSAIAALSGVVVAYIFKNFGQDINIFYIILIAIALGGLFGLFNGLLVGYGKVPSFIATLGMASIIRGIAYFVVGGTWIGEHFFSDSFKNFANIKNLIIIVFIVIVLSYLFLNFFKAGRNIYAIGTNKTAAEMIGVNSKKTTLIVFIIAGILAGFSGIIWSSRYGVAQSDSALGFELMVIIAVIIGGTSIVGGRGTIRGVIISAFLLQILTNALGILGVSQFWKLGIQGIIILIAFTTDSIVVEKTTRKLI